MRLSIERDFLLEAVEAALAAAGSKPGDEPRAPGAPPKAPQRRGAADPEALKRHEKALKQHRTKEATYARRLAAWRAKTEKARVLIDVQTNGAVSVSATSDMLSLCATTRNPAQVMEEGQAYLPGYRLARILSTAPEGRVAMETDDADPTAVRLRIGRTRHSLHGGDPGLAPRWQSERSTPLTVDEGALLEALGAVQYAITRDPNRPHFEGAFVRCMIKGDDVFLDVLATDGVQAARVRRRIDRDPAQVPAWAESGHAWLSKDVCSAALKAFTIGERVRLISSDSQVGLHGDHILLRGRAVSARRPPVEQLVERRPPGQRITLDRRALTAALKRAHKGPVQGDGHYWLEVTPDALYVCAFDPEQGAYEEAVTITAGQPVNIGVDPARLLAALKVHDCDEIALDIVGDTEPVLICGDDAADIHLMMPAPNVMARQRAGRAAA